MWLSSYLYAHEEQTSFGVLSRPVAKWHISKNLFFFFSQRLWASNFYKLNLCKYSQSCINYTCFLWLQSLPVDKSQGQPWINNTHATSSRGVGRIEKGKRGKEGNLCLHPHRHIDSSLTALLSLIRNPACSSWGKKTSHPKDGSVVYFPRLFQE